MGQRDEAKISILASKDFMGSVDPGHSMKFLTGKYYSVSATSAAAMVAQGQASLASAPGGTPTWHLHLGEGGQASYWQAA